jgi:hypothetical protein
MFVVDRRGTMESSYQASRNPNVFLRHSRIELAFFLPMSFGNPTFVSLIVGQASRLPLNGLRSQASRPRYI